MKYLGFLFLLVSSLSLISCGGDDTDADCQDIDKQLAIDTKLIDDYLASNNIVAQKTVQGVYYNIIEPGGDAKPKITSSLIVNYKGYYLDGTVFDSGTNISFNLFDVIQGWQIGMPKFGKGGKGKLFIPSKFGYGCIPPSSIRKEAVLVFDIELIDFD
jgi:FKBP-type peptidyl-prolyl cis-trans isomerase FkpA